MYCRMKPERGLPTIEAMTPPSMNCATARARMRAGNQSFR